MPLENCSDCKTEHTPSEARGTRCPRCHQRHLSREWSKWNYHGRTKKDPALLAQHRAKAKEEMRRYRADPAKREAANARRRKPKKGGTACAS